MICFLNHRYYARHNATFSFVSEPSRSNRTYSLHFIYSQIFVEGKQFLSKHTINYFQSKSKIQRAIMKDQSIYHVSIEVAKTVTLKKLVHIATNYNILFSIAVMEKRDQPKRAQHQYCRISLKVPHYLERKDRNQSSSCLIVDTLLARHLKG